MDEEKAEKKYIEYVEDRLCDILLSLVHDRVLSLPIDCTFFIQFRPFNDLRYPMNSSKVKALGWKQRIGWKEGIAKTGKMIRIWDY